MNKRKILVFAIDPIAGEESTRGLDFSTAQKSKLEALALQQKYHDKPLYDNPDESSEVAVVHIKPVIGPDDKPEDFLKLSKGEWDDIKGFVGNSNDVGVYVLSHFGHLPLYYFGAFARNAFNAVDLANFVNELPKHGVNWSKLNTTSCDFAMPSPTDSDVSALRQTLSTEHVSEVKGQKLHLASYRHPVYVNAPESQDPGREPLHQSDRFPTVNDLDLTDPNIGKKQYQPRRNAQDPKVFKEEVAELGYESKVYDEFTMENPVWARVDRVHYADKQLVLEERPPNKEELIAIRNRRLVELIRQRGEIIEEAQLDVVNKLKETFEGEVVDIEGGKIYLLQTDPSVSEGARVIEMKLDVQKYPEFERAVIGQQFRVEMQHKARPKIEAISDITRRQWGIPVETIRDSNIRELIDGVADSLRGSFGSLRVVHTPGATTRDRECTVYASISRGHAEEPSSVRMNAIDSLPLEIRERHSDENLMELAALASLRQQILAPRIRPPARRTSLRTIDWDSEDDRRPLTRPSKKKPGGHLRHITDRDGEESIEREVYRPSRRAFPLLSSDVPPRRPTTAPPPELIARAIASEQQWNANSLLPATPGAPKHEGIRDKFKSAPGFLDRTFDSARLSVAKLLEISPATLNIKKARGNLTGRLVGEMGDHAYIQPVNINYKPGYRSNQKDEMLVPDLVYRVNVGRREDSATLAGCSPNEWVEYDHESKRVTPLNAKTVERDESLANMRRRSKAPYLELFSRGYLKKRNKWFGKRVGGNVGPTVMREASPSLENQEFQRRPSGNRTSDSGLPQEVSQKFLKEFRRSHTALGMPHTRPQARSLFEDFLRQQSATPISEAQFFNNLLEEVRKAKLGETNIASSSGLRRSPTRSISGSESDEPDTSPPEAPKTSRRKTHF